MSLLEVQRMLSQRIASEQAEGPFQISPNTGKKSPRIPYFEYSSHYNVKEFQAKCPGAKPIAIAWLRDWMWHLNTSGVPNIRMDTSRPYKTWYEGARKKIPKEYNISRHSIPIEAIGVVGFLYLITPRQAHMMDRAYIHKVRVSFRVDSFPCFENKRLPDRLDMAVQAHWDPHDTCDNQMNIMMNTDERRAWLIGLMQLRISGVPEPYMDRIFALLHGHHQPYPLATPNYHPISELLQLEKRGLLSPSITQESLPSMKLRQEEKKRLQAVIRSAQGQDAADELLRQKRKFALAHLGTRSAPLPFSKADQSNATAGYKLDLQAPKKRLPDAVPVPPVMPNSPKENTSKEREKPEAPLEKREDDVQGEKEQAEVAGKKKAKHEAWLAEQVRLGYDGFFC